MNNNFIVRSRVLLPNTCDLICSYIILSLPTITNTLPSWYKGTLQITVIIRRLTQVYKVQKYRKIPSVPMFKFAVLYCYEATDFLEWIVSHKCYKSWPSPGWFRFDKLSTSWAWSNLTRMFLKQWDSRDLHHFGNRHYISLMLYAKSIREWKDLRQKLARKLK